MTPFAIGQRVRVVASVGTLHAGKVGVIVQQMIASGKYKVVFDGVDAHNRKLFGTFKPDELEPADDEMALFERFLSGELTLDEWGDLANARYPRPAERITYVRDGDDVLRVAWVRENEDERALAAAA